MSPWIELPRSYHIQEEGQVGYTSTLIAQIHSMLQLKILHAKYFKQFLAVYQMARSQCITM